MLLGTLLPGSALGQTVIRGSSPSAALPMPAIIRPDGAVHASAGGPEAGARIGADGHFHFEALLNGVAVPMLFDTGATLVSLRAEDAARLNMDPAMLAYNVSMNTANGRARGAGVTLASMTVGGITRTNVRAVVHQAGSLHDNLLGQSFLGRLAGYRQTGDRLVLIGGG